LQWLDRLVGRRSKYEEITSLLGCSKLFHCKIYR